ERVDGRARASWRDPRHRWAICRRQGVRRWLHDHPRARSGRSPRLGAQARDCAAASDRSATGSGRHDVITTAEIERAFRREHGRAVAVLIRRCGGDIALAEEVVQDAFVAALERWPATGVPPSPAGWIITTARHRAIDRFRRDAMRADRHARAFALLGNDDPPDGEATVRDDQLRLIFTCCHPALAVPARVALTLRLVGGLATHEIARAFLVPEATMAQRLVRAKSK